MEQQRRIVPPIYFLGSLLAMAGLHRWCPITRVLEPPVSYAGVALMMLGVAAAASAVAAFKRVGTPVIPFKPSTVLVTTGLYRFTRNPMYLGLVIGLVGGAVLSGTLGAWLPIPVFVWIITTRFIEGEERFLEGIFGDDYVRYRRHVRRWL